MQFNNEFTVEAPIDEVYAALLDPDRVAPAMPGAEVLEKVSDDVYKVAIKIRLGPVTMTYRGEVEIVDKNPAEHSASMKVKAKEARGQGTANATVQMACEEAGGATQVTMTSDVQLSGKAAAMGRGIIEDVSSRLVDTFASNLADVLASPGTASGDEEAVSTASASSSGSSEPAVSGATGGQAQGATPGVSERESAAGRGEPAPEPPPSQPTSPKSAARPAASAPADDGLDALSLGAGIVADRLKDPRVLGGVLGGVLLVGYLIGRRG
jgi:carbon monoxide dehydrogenase subunit G